MHWTGPAPRTIERTPRLTVAAIWYVVDQNEPSRPFLLDVDCPAEPAPHEFERALTAYFVAKKQEERDDYERDFGEPMTDVPIAAEFRLCPEGHYGDAQVLDPNEDDTILFVSVSCVARDVLGLPPRR